MFLRSAKITGMMYVTYCVISRLNRDYHRLIVGHVVLLKFK